MISPRFYPVMLERLSSANRFLVFLDWDDRTEHNECTERAEPTERTEILISGALQTSIFSPVSYLCTIIEGYSVSIYVIGNESLRCFGFAELNYLVLGNKFFIFEFSFSFC